MNHYLLFYDVSEDFLQRREAFRQEHLRLAWAASASGELLLAGALGPPTDTAALLFQGSHADVAERFARADPYVRHGLVKAWRVRQWHTVAGGQAAAPVRPAAAPPA